MKNFKTYQLALQLHGEVKEIKLPYYLRDQLLRASSSIALNLAEGSGKMTKKDKARFYSIALGSLREVQAILELENLTQFKAFQTADFLGGSIYQLWRNT